MGKIFPLRNCFSNILIRINGIKTKLRSQRPPASVGVNGNELVYVDAFKFLGLGVLIGQLESLIVSSLPRPPVPVVTLGNQKWSKTAKITVGFRRQNLKRDIRSSPPSLVASSWPPESHYFGTSGQNLSKYPQTAVTDFRP